MILNSELEMIGEEAVMAYFKVLSKNQPGRTKKYHESP
jgi:hypothetical protein